MGRLIFTGMLSLFLLGGCHATSIEISDADLGEAKSFKKMKVMLGSKGQIGPIAMTKHLAARWEVDRSGLINLDNPKAVAAGLVAGPESIELYVYTLTHPEFGTFLVDSGISERFLDMEENKDLSFIVSAAMNTDALKVVETTKEIIEVVKRKTGDSIKGVFLTHIHLDHIMGLTDLVKGTPVYIGPGDAHLSSFENLFSQGTTDRLLENVNVMKEWTYASGAETVDIFGDGSVWALHSPGHTPGSTAYLVQTTSGLELITGDVCHTRWGWNEGVEPGTFSLNQPESLRSLNTLKKLVADVSGIKVHPGHQSL